MPGFRTTDTTNSQELISIHICSETAKFLVSLVCGQSDCMYSFHNFVMRSSIFCITITITSEKRGIHSIAPSFTYLHRFVIISMAQSAIQIMKW